MHTTFYKGKRVHVILRDGRRFVDRFVEKKRSSVVFVDLGELSLRKIRSMSDYKQRESYERRAIENN